MKYIKLYEKREIRKCWLLPLDDRFEQSLIKIKCPKTQIEKFLAMRDFFRSDGYFFPSCC